MSEPPSYLWFALKLGDNKKRPGYMPGYEFELHLSSREDSAFKEGLALIYVWIRLGGLGFRANRGAGCMKLNKLEITQGEVARELESEIRSKPPLSQLDQFISRWLPPSIVARSSNTDPRFLIGVFKIEKTFEEPHQALDELDKYWHALRTSKPEDKDYVNIGKQDRDNSLDAGRGTGEMTVKRAAFGFPFKQRKPFGKQGGEEWHYFDKEDEEKKRYEEKSQRNRLASPFHLRPLLDYQGGGELFYPACLIFTEKLVNDTPGKIHFKNFILSVDRDGALQAVKKVFSRKIFHIP